MSKNARGRFSIENGTKEHISQVENPRLLIFTSQMVCLHPTTKHKSVG